MCFLIYLLKDFLQPASFWLVFFFFISTSGVIVFCLLLLFPLFFFLQPVCTSIKGSAWLATTFFIYWHILYFSTPLVNAAAVRPPRKLKSSCSVRQEISSRGVASRRQVEVTHGEDAALNNCSVYQCSCCWCGRCRRPPGGLVSSRLRALTSLSASRGFHRLTAAAAAAPLPVSLPEMKLTWMHQWNSWSLTWRHQ